VTRRDLSDRGDRLRTLLVFVVLQGFLLIVNPRLLPMWGDEAAALNPAATVHAPLYFLLAHAWLKLTRASDPLSSLRLLSGLFAICSTILLDRLWLQKVAAETRQWVLLLWMVSPSILLFGRMAHSYSLQVLLTVVAIWSLLRFVEESSSWKRLAALAATLTALLYTHALPGIAVWAGANVMLLMRLRADAAPKKSKPSEWRMWLLPNAVVAAAYLPQMVALARALPQSGNQQIYSLTGNIFLEAGLKLAYGFYALAFGEAIPKWLLALSALLIAPYVWVLVRGAASAGREWALPAATVALLAYIGAAHEVSYPFMGTRLLFLLPLTLLGVAAGIGKLGHIGTVFGVALFAANAGGVWSYFEVHDILNIAYLAPHQRIATLIAFRSKPADTVVWVDGLNVDDTVLAYYLPAGYPVRVLRSAADADAAWAELEQNSRIQHVWFLRNSQDHSAGHVFEKLEERVRGSWHSHAMYPYVSSPPVYRAAAKAVMHVARPPQYIYELWEFLR
jgi:hypothetical protein